MVEVRKIFVGVDQYTFDFPVSEIREGVDHVISPMVNIVRYWIFYRDARYYPEMGTGKYREFSLWYICLNCAVL